MPLALGLIETKGLVGAIEAADAMAKAANVRIVGREKVVPALITIKIVGDVAAVHAAVEAGAAAAQRVGQLVSKHVIAQPDEQMAALFPEIMESATPATKPEEKVEVAEQKPEPVVVAEEIPELVFEEIIEEVVPEPVVAEPEITEEVIESEVPEQVEDEPVPDDSIADEQPQEESQEVVEESAAEQQPASSDSTTDNDSTDEHSSDDEESKKKISQGENEEAKSDVDGATLVRLLEANKPQTPPQQTTQVSNTPILYNGKDVSLLSVVELRNLARTVANFPIKGREISKANKTTLLAHFNS